MELIDKISSIDKAGTASGSAFLKERARLSDNVKLTGVIDLKKGLSNKTNKVIRMDTSLNNPVANERKTFRA